jgi:hypothetical protein
MAKKILLSALALSLVLASAAFAGGQKEPVPGAAAPAAATAKPPFATGEKLTLSGALSLEGQWHPVLKSGGKEYELLVPRHLTWNIDVKDGEQVTVEGYVVQGRPRAGQDDGDVDLFVTKATIQGKEYDLSQYRGPMMGGPGQNGGPGYGPRGRQPGMRGGGSWGPGMRGGRAGNRGGWGTGCPGCGYAPPQG